MSPTEKPDTVGYDLASSPVHVSLQQRLGFGVGYEPRRHNNEAGINRATHSARLDWQRYIGPIDKFGGANPYHGNFVSLVLPFTLPDRVAVLTYLIECRSLYIKDPQFGVANIVEPQTLSCTIISATLQTKLSR
jgi:hypothetical protein